MGHAARLGGRRRSRVGTVVGMIAAAAAVSSYSASDWSRIPLHQAARDAFVAEGRAQTFVHTGSGVIHVRTAGPETGPIVMLVHGGVVVPDLLGYGYSDRPEIPYTREFYLGQLRGLIDALGVERPVNLAGASFGGIVVAEFAAENPKDVASVALMAPAGLRKGGVVNPLLLLPVIGDWVFRVLGVDVVTRQMAAAYAGSPDQRAMLDWMDEQSKYRGFAEGILNSLRHYDFEWRPEVYQTLGRSRIPVFAAWGTEDTVHPYERVQVLHDYLPQTKLLTLDGAGHAITYGRAEDVVEGYSQFLAGTPC